MNYNFESIPNLWLEATEFLQMMKLIEIKLNWN